jgi:hypothetical protein
METSIYNFVMTRLDATRDDWKAVAEGSGVPYSTVYKIGTSIVKDPGVSLIERLANYFRANPPPRTKLHKKQQPHAA